jgi:hypothetical protein
MIGYIITSIITFIAIVLYIWYKGITDKDEIEFDFKW